ncbi:MAG TPA: CU044_5270 family protein [Phytomonospora sp.]
MTDTNDHLAKVAAFREGLDADTSHRMASMRAAVLKGTAMPTTARRTSLRLAAIALPVAAAVAIGVGVVAADGENPTGDQAQTQTPDLATMTAGDVLALAADNAGEYASYDVADGAFVHRRTTGRILDGDSGELVDYTADRWYQIDHGMRVVVQRSTVNGGEDPKGTFDLREDDGYDLPFDEADAGLWSPSEAWLAALPTDPAALLTVLLEQSTAYVHAEYPDTSWYDGQEELFVADMSMVVLANASAIMTSEQRAAFFGMLSTMDEVTRVDGMVEDGLGREGVAFALTVTFPEAEDADTPYTREIILDPNTSAILGTRQSDGGKVVELMAYEDEVVADIED